MSDCKSIAELREEHSNLNDYISSLYEVINESDKNNLDLRLTIDHLKNELEQNKKWTATVYTPNQPSYKDLELKLKNFETNKQKEIDELKRLNRSTEQRIAEYIEDKTSLNREIQQLKQSSLNLTNDVFDLRRKNKLLCSVIDFAVGYISATQPHTDKHPMEVKRWLFEGFERLQ